MTQMEIDLKNTRLMLKYAEKKVELLTGCPSFGESDCMDGSCQTCFHENRTQFDRCIAFEYAVREYKNLEEPRKKAEDVPPICKPF